MAQTRLSTEHEDIEVPFWLSRHADIWIKIRGVEAVLLFGSHALGRAQVDSDWDIAILYRNREPDDIPMGSDLMSHPVDIPLVPLQEYVEQAHMVGSLAHELAVKGKVLAGSVPEVSERSIVVSEVDLALHVEYAFRELSLALCEILEELRTGDRELTLKAARAFASSKYSADGAERIAKALCVHLGITYEHTNDLTVPSQQVPKEWRKKVLAMDGKARRAHVAGYRGSFESVEKAYRRVFASLDLLDEILKPCCQQLSLSRLRELNQKVSSSTGMQMLTYKERESKNPEIVELFDKIQNVKEDSHKYAHARER